MYILRLTPEPKEKPLAGEIDDFLPRYTRIVEENRGSLRVVFPVRSYQPWFLLSGATGTRIEFSDNSALIVMETVDQIDAMLLRDHRNTIMLMTAAGVRRTS